MGANSHIQWSVRLMTYGDRPKGLFTPPPHEISLWFQLNLMHTPSPTPYTTVSAAIPQTGEWVWDLDKSGSQMTAEVCWTPHGWELRLFLDGHFRYAHRHATRSLALDDATSCLQQFETSGWSRPGAEALREIVRFDSTV